MVLNACIELTTRILINLGQFFSDNLGMVFLTLGVLSLIVGRISPLMLGIVAELFNMPLDLAFGFVISSILAGIIIGFIWASMIFFSPVNSLIKLINAPFMFFLGFIWGFLPIPLPLTVLIGFLMRFKIANYFIAIAPSILYIGFIYLAGPTNLCSGANWVVKLIG